MSSDFEKMLVNEQLMGKIKTIQFIIECLKNDIEDLSYDKIADNVSSLNTSICSFLENLKKL